MRFNHAMTFSLEKDHSMIETRRLKNVTFIQTILVWHLFSLGRLMPMLCHLV